jgi:hypothetical protein
LNGNGNKTDRVRSFVMRKKVPGAVDVQALPHGQGY